MANNPEPRRIHVHALDDRVRMYTVPAEQRVFLVPDSKTTEAMRLARLLELRRRAAKEGTAGP